ncbi:hypothetical protein PAXRUDRAFT_85434, partial [Paxillus rubicundulus Ve08.2h10]
MCPACGKDILKTPQGVLKHLGQSKGCQWYWKKKLQDLRQQEPEPPEALITHQAAPYGEEGSEYKDDQPPEDSEPEDEHQPIASTSQIILEYDERVEDVYPGTGRVIWMGESLHQQWRSSFKAGRQDQGNAKEDIEMENGTDAGNQESRWYSPFASELDWRIAQWAIEEGMGQNSLTRLLEIPGVVDSLGLSYHNMHTMHQVVDIIPGCSKWKTCYISFPDQPEDKHFIQYRDPIEVIQALLGNPAFAKHLVFTPRKIFSDVGCSRRIYNEMWTGKW